MRAFDYRRPASVDEALHLRALPGAVFLAGGTNLVDLAKGGVVQASLLVDVTRLPLDSIEPLPDGGLRIGAMARNTVLANHRLVRERYPLLTQAVVAGASAQLRNMATAGGNLLQRTRCGYFYDIGFPACNKRQPGSGCAARDGLHRNHAILGASSQCIATHPSDFCVALAALRATVRVRSLRGERGIAMADFHRLPADAPQRDTTLEDDEIVTAIDLPPSRFARHASYLKIRDRASFAFALVSVAAALDVQDGVVQDAALALGGVAHKPWRVPQAEAALVGRPLDAAAMEGAADALLRGAVPLPQNAYKLPLVRRAVVRALQDAAAVPA
jgi:xanthine dehydrogenase YagS FAD-binding subunit